MPEFFLSGDVASGGNGSRQSPWGDGDAWEAAVTTAAAGGNGATVFLSGAWATGIAPTGLEGIAPPVIEPDSEVNQVVLNGDGPLGAAVFDIDLGVVVGIDIVGDYITLTNLQVDGVTEGVETRIGVRAEGATGIIVDNVIANDSGWDGIQINDVIDSTIRNSKAKSNGVRGITISGVSVNCHGWDCVTEGNGRRGFTLSGDTLTQTQVNCGFNRCRSFGDGGGASIDHGTGQYLDDFIASGMRENNRDPFPGSATFQAIEVLSAARAQITNFECYTNRDSPPTVDGLIGVNASVADETGDLVIANGLVDGGLHSGTGSYGIAIADANICPRHSITGCVIRNCERAVRIPDNAGCHYCFNILDGNFLEGYRIAGAITNADMLIYNNIFINGIDYIYTSSGTHAYLVDSNYYGSNGVDRLVRESGSDYTEANIATLDANAVVGTSAALLFRDAPNGDYRLPDGHALNAGGNRYWGNGARPMGYAGEPFEDFDPPIGYRQPINAFHPMRL